MTQKFTDIYDFSFSNTTAQNIPCSFRFRRPDFFKNNMNKKRCRIQKFTVNNKFIPLYIPTNVTDSSYYNVLPNATSNSYQGNSLTVNSMQYFIIIRKTDNSVAEVLYFQYVPESNQYPVPTSVITDQTQYYLNQYYYYRDFTNFLFNLQNMINTYTGSGSFPISANCNFTMNLSSNSFSLYINKLFIDGGYQIEFSQSLIDLFPFKNAMSPYTTGQSSFVLYYSNFVTTSGANQYYSTSCAMYESIFPFSELLIASEDLGVNFTKFIQNIDMASNNQQAAYESTILGFNIRTSQFATIYRLLHI